MSDSPSALLEDDPAALAAAAAEAHKTKPADEHKMVLIVRADLAMTKGKIGAQCGHATIGAFKRALRQAPTALEIWQRWGATKVCLKVQTQAELVELQQKAAALDLVSYLVQDAGRTQVVEGSETVLAIGPAPIADIDSICGHLRLL